MKPAVTRLRDYAPPTYLVDRVELVVELDPDLTRVEATQHLRRNPAGGREPLRLTGRGLDLIEIRLDGVVLASEQYEFSKDELILHPQSDAFELKITTHIHPRENRSALGLFPDGGNLITHMEPEGFSRITFFQERPDILSPYIVRLEADRTKYPHLLSNGNPVSGGVLPGNRHFAVWSDPIPKPCYIFAIAAGEYEPVFDTFTTASGRTVRLGIYATPQHRGALGFAMDALKRAMAWDEKVFGFEYDLDVFNIVVADTHAIAMENKGLNILESALVAADPQISTDADYDLVERIIAHEYFHNWTGNRITCRDWFQLSLKEGLTRFRDQMFAEHQGAADLKRIAFVRALRTNQLPEDSGGGAHPVQPDAYQAVSNLYTATVYDKGAEIVRMLRTQLGEETFIRGVVRFARTFDGQGATIGDFLGALSEVSETPLDPFWNWYRHAGTPVIDIAVDFDAPAGRLHLSFEQRLAKDAAQRDALPIPFRLAFVMPDGNIRDEGVIELRSRVETRIFEGFETAPVISANRGFSAPVRLRIEQSPGDLAAIVRSETDGVARWDAMQELMRRAVDDFIGGDETTAAKLVSCMGEMLAQPEPAHGMKAELLTFVHIGLVADRRAVIDPGIISDAIVTLRRRFAAAFQHELLDMFRNCGGTASEDLSNEARGQRRLRALCLDYLLETGVPAYQELAVEEVCNGAGMTARSAALYALCDHACPARDRAVQNFYEEFHDRPGALRIWFRAQASSRLPGTAARVAELSQHPDFDLSNTPLAMALFGGFFRQNRAAFHVIDGAGYRLLSKVLKHVDQVRPQGTGWLMPQVMNWRRFEPIRRNLIRHELNALAATPDLSAVLAENLERALQGESEAA